mmetsp:Transcript_43010/g.103696  ORF Transcript_43010/g.103696 Transcript_43010/m.103696 type:complete len:308 (-) Transcript_43010:3745-4668(-)
MGVQHATQLLGLQRQHIWHELIAPCQLHHLLVAVLLELTLRIEDPRDTPAHACSKIGAGLTQDHHTSTCHVLASVVTNSLDDHPGAGVSDGETLGGDPAEEGQAAGCSVHAHVADNDVLLGIERRIAWGVHDDGTSRQPLSSVIVGITLELQHHPLGQESSHRVPTASLHPHVHQPRWQRVRPPPLGKLGREQGSHGPVVVANVVVVHDTRVTKPEGHVGSVDEVAIDKPLEHWEMFLGVQLAVLHLANLASVRHAVRRHQNGQHLQLRRPGGLESLVVLQCLSVADHLIHGAEAQLGHDCAALLGD